MAKHEWGWSRLSDSQPGGDNKKIMNADKEGDDKENNWWYLDLSYQK